MHFSPQRIILLWEPSNETFPNISNIVYKRKNISQINTKFHKTFQCKPMIAFKRLKKPLRDYWALTNHSNKDFMKSSFLHLQIVQTNFNFWYSKGDIHFFMGYTKVSFHLQPSTTTHNHPQPPTTIHNH